MNAKGHKFEIPEGFDKQDLLFLAISGSHAYGTARPDSDVDIRGVWIPYIDQVVSITMGMLKKTFTHNNYTDYIDIELKSLPNYLSLLAKGNCNCLENLFQEKIWEHDALRSLQKLVMEKGIHKGFISSFKGFSISQQRDFHKKRKTKCLLYVFRLLAEGIYLFDTGKIEMDINKLYEYAESPLLDEILSNYHNEQSVQGTGIVHKMDTEIEKLRERLEESKNNADIPEEANYQIYNDWYYDFYMAGYDY